MLYQINLLPWRQQQRQQEAWRFFRKLLLWVGLLSGSILAINYFLCVPLINQNLRQQMLKQAIFHLDSQIAEAQHLRQKRKLLISRVVLIQQLQETRTLVIHLLDELPKIMPPQVYLTHLVVKKNSVSISGYATANRYISRLMQRIEHNPWMSHPVLKQIRATVQKKQVTHNEFKLVFMLSPERRRKSR